MKQAAWIIIQIIILTNASVSYSYGSYPEKMKADITAAAVKEPHITESTRDSLQKVYRLIEKRKLGPALKILNNIKDSDSSSADVLYLKGEILLLYGNAQVNNIITALEKNGEHKYADILKLKMKYQLGEGALSEVLSTARRKHGDLPEFRLVEFLYKLDRGEYKWAMENYRSVEKGILFSYIPSYALFIHASDENSTDALRLMRELKASIGYDNKTAGCSLEMDSMLAVKNTGQEADVPVEIEMPFFDGGAYFGMIMEDSAGSRLSLTLDTGTSGGLLTVHNSEAGRKLSGQDVKVIPKGIWYNYMEHAEDLHLKTASFTTPPLKDFPVFYFKGNFDNADGVFSPFAFRELAVSVDVPERKVFLRNRKALEQYIEKVRMNDYEEVDFVIRDGWIYIPCRINSKEVLMMVESGSRDVNFNRISAEYLGLKVYPDSLLWKGKYIKCNKTDTEIEIGQIKYKVKGGFVEDFMLGNQYFGAGAAGDIGPVFLRKYPFTIDPFRRKIIFETGNPAKGS